MRNAVGAIGADQPNAVVCGALALVEYPWPGGETLLTDSATTVYGAQQLDQLGSALARVGDVDGDGLEDLAVGAGGLSQDPWPDENALSDRRRWPILLADSAELTPDLA